MVITPFGGLQDRYLLGKPFMHAISGITTAYGVFTIAPIERLVRQSICREMKQEHTRNNVQHVSIIQTRWNIALFLLFDERLEHSDRGAMDIARYEADACVRGLSILLHLDDKPIPFLLVRLGSPMVVLAPQVSLASQERRKVRLQGHRAALHPR